MGWPTCKTDALSTVLSIWPQKDVFLTYKQKPRICICAISLLPWIQVDGVPGTFIRDGMSGDQG